MTRLAGAASDLEIASCFDAACTSGFFKQTIDYTGKVGVSPSVAVGPDGLPLIAYEDAVLQLVPAHGGFVRERVRTDGADGAPLEIHVLEFPSEDALDAYMQDPQRLAMADSRERAIERTAVYRVDLVGRAG